MLWYVNRIVPLAGAAIALAATVGSASAAEQFTTLGGVTAVPMSTSQMERVRAAGPATAVLVTLNLLNATVESGGEANHGFVDGGDFAVLTALVTKILPSPSP